MKKLTFLSIIIIFAAFNCTAQQNLSIRMGYDIPSGNFNNKELQNQHGIKIGTNYDFMLSNTFSIRPGLYYLIQWESSDKIGELGVDFAKELSNSYKVTADSRYHFFANVIEIPIVAAWQKKNFDFEIGPYISTVFATRHSIGGKKYDSTYDLKKFDFGFKGSFGYNILGKYYIGFSYEQGVRNLYKNDDNSNNHGRTQRIGINVGYRF